MNANKIRVAVGMSGGVDSTVTAILLKSKGYDVIGLTMQVWDGSLPLKDGGSACYGPSEPHDLEEVARLAARLGIEHHPIPLAGEYKRHVLDYFRNEYLSGRTPNPCVMCNQKVKFGSLIERARAQGISFDFFATGHYARVRHDPARERYLLLRGLDPSKDQSYFLSHLTQDQLRQLILPLGEMTKTQVREFAREAGLAELAEKEESQDFIESSDYDVLFTEKKAEPGPIVDVAGRVLGQHKGIIHYTIGQRKGIGIAGKEPLYVLRIDACSKSIVVGPREALYSRTLRAFDVNWIARQEPPSSSIRLDMKIRQQHKAAPASIVVDAAAPDTIICEFDEPQMSITPGQIAVLYDGDEVAGGGVIGVLQA